MSIKKTYSVLTTVLLEHNYINFFIEYHIKLGFNKIYVLIDNSYIVQDEYIIENVEYKKNIIFIDIRILDQIPLLNNLKINCEQNKCHKCIYIHACLQYVYKNIMVEDYTILLGIDSFLFLDNLTIQEYFIKYNITDDICQIFFKWICIFNVSEPKYNMFENINLNKIHYSNHFFTLGNRKLVIEPHESSHYFSIKNDNSKIFHDNKIDTINKNTTFIDIANLICKNHTKETKETTNNYIYHFNIRNMYDVFVKTYYYWNSNNIKKNDIKIIYNDLIKNYKFPKADGKYLRIDFLQFPNETKVKPFNILVNIQNKDYLFNYKEFIDMIKECNITQEQFLSFVNKYSHDEKYHSKL